ncbi:aminoglycoside 3-N-acetyltransferase [Paenibacillus swuensis]|uniref:Aminoglycoside N(3)-acetyltransferase n=1 Tax=Paenibacillus swuensis TaxID=1178515 RepID=A0A172TIY6_9BACL|nr:AAC(3) family N-acetyltransferase [Paenibacillus swuensis]ANE46998.1 aminoglycoside 3-N-acetyltransferase [Paenibacillus swuensis]
MAEHEPKKIVTITGLTRDLEALGLRQGMTVIVHSSMKALGGWVCGGPQAVIESLQQVVGTEGTLVMPTQSGDLSEPSYWSRPPVPTEWWETIRREMPAYDAALTTTRGVGILPETFRKGSGVLRGEHPQLSFAAWGKHAEHVVSPHGLQDGLGDASPLGRLYELGAFVLMLGAKHDSNTSLHLSEYRASFAGKKEIMQGAPVMSGGERQWVEYFELELDSDDFEVIGEAFGREKKVVQVGQVADAASMLMPMRDLVDYGVTWIEAFRGTQESEG